ncbi:MAG: DUF4392 domain-containing protein [Chloroflexi bacterium]|nr:DUF4392 domain-containing protein [Chloroflexota bacterium]MCY4111690.1 DUF4392 domain-containing protein [Chloroflexota bacterium]
MTTSRHRNAAAAVEIAEVVFPTDSRGLGACRRLLPGDAFARAATAIADRPPAQAMLLTGFPVGGIGETDGPPGAMAVGQTLAALGWGVVTVACDTTFPVVDALLADIGPVIAAPITERDTQAACEALRREYSPDLVVAIERPGATADGRRLTMRGEDITGIAAALDPLMRAPLSVAVGDGGNEIGMGVIAPSLQAKGLIPGVSVTRASHLLLAEVSNWGAYGLVAMLDFVTGRDTLPDGDTEQEWIERLVAAGAVDGMTRSNTAMVDGHSLEVNARMLASLRSIVDRCRGAPGAA